jgi:hypothetical protein
MAAEWIFTFSSDSEIGIKILAMLPCIVFRIFIHLFIYGLFNSLYGNCILSDCTVTGKLWSAKGVQLIFVACFKGLVRRLFGRTEEEQENFCQDSQYPKRH